MALVLAGGPAAAHLLAPQTATMNIVGTSAYLVVSVPVSALHTGDDDRDGRLSLAELGRHNRAIGAEFSRRFTLTSAGRAGTPLLTWVMTPQTGDDARNGMAYVVVMQRLVWPVPPLHPHLTTDLFGAGPGEAVMTLHASTGPIAEIAVLTPDRPHHRFFGTSLDTLADFIAIGVGHILGGADHLLFLLTIIVPGILTGAGWRHWLAIITGFTAAHSLTLTAAVLGWVHVAPAIVEPAIAASIMAMALLNLTGAAVSGDRVRLPLVMACGLLHGLGFASALGDMGLDTGHRLASLAGFNIGVEIGQFGFVAALLALGALLRRWGGEARRGQALRLASATALLLGGAMLVQRIGAVT